MSARDRSVWRCQQCGFASPKPGTCPDCRRATGELTALIEERQGPPSSTRRSALPQSHPRPLKEVSLERTERLRTGIGELDRVLGGGVVPGSLVLIGGDPGIGKCVTADTRVLDPTTGHYLPITAWAQISGRSVLALDEPTLQFQPRPVAMFHHRGIRDVVEVRTKLGRLLRCTPDHPVLTPDGWRPVEELGPGSRVAAPRALPCFGRDALPEAAVKLLGYVLSDGSTQATVTVTSELAEVADDLEEIAVAFGARLVRYAQRGSRAIQFRFVCDKARRRAARRSFAQTLRAVRERAGLGWEAWAKKAGVSAALLNVWRRAECVPGDAELERLARAVGLTAEALGADVCRGAEMQTPVAQFLDLHGVRYLKARQKAVPACVFRLPRKELALFLKALFTCDGSVYVRADGQAGVSYATISRRLAEDVHHLLLRFGLVATLRTKTSMVAGKPYRSYELALFGHSNVQRFLSDIGIVGRTLALEQISAASKPRRPSTGRDTIPTGRPFWERLRSIPDSMSFARLRRTAGATIRNRRHDRPLARATVRALAHTLNDQRLRALADGDVYWDTVANVTPVGPEHVYDLTVSDGDNFVANDLVVHNSTVLLQAARALAETAPPVLYVSAEESAAQVKLRAERLGVAADGLLLWSENDLAVVQAELDTVKPQALVVDSIQTVFLPELESAPGSVAQVRECGARLMALAKGRGLATFIVGHVTKDGALAGPRVLEHLVDTVLYFEGEQHHAYRVLRAVKNRFGSTNEIGVFQMGERGLVEVPNPSGFFLAERPQDAPGSVIVAGLEGTRPLLLELQALVTPASFGTPRRTVIGADYNRTCLLLAVLEKRAGVPLGTQDVFVNVAGGARIVEPAADLGVVVAAASSYMDRAVRGDVVVIGEVGLTGEVRAVTGLEARLREAAALGFREAVVPQSNLAEQPKLPLEARGVTTVHAALDLLVG